MRNENGNNSIITFIGLLLIAFLSAIAISTEDFIQQTNQIPNKKPFSYASLKDDYDNQELNLQKRISKCERDLDKKHTYRNPDAYWPQAPHYKFNWLDNSDSNSITILARDINGRGCNYYGTYELDKIYKVNKKYWAYYGPDDVEVQYSIEEKKLVQYIKTKSGRTYRSVLFCCFKN